MSAPKHYTNDFAGMLSSTPVLSPRVLAMHMKEIPESDKDEILGDLFERDHQVKLAQALPTRDGKPRPAYLVSPHMQPRGVLGLWINETGSGATIGVLRAALESNPLFVSARQRLDAWINERAKRL